MFLLQYQPQIHRVIFLFALVCLILDIVSVVKGQSVKYYYAVEIDLQGASTFIPDVLLLWVFFKTAKNDYRIQGDRTPQDWNKPPKDPRQLAIPKIHLIGKIFLLILTVFWPAYEIHATSQIQQPLVANTSSATQGPYGQWIRLYPLASNMIPFLHLSRARNCICLAICVLIAIDIRISYGRWNLKNVKKGTLAKSPSSS